MVSKFNHFNKYHSFIQLNLFTIQTTVGAFLMGHNFEHYLLSDVNDMRLFTVSVIFVHHYAYIVSLIVGFIFFFRSIITPHFNDN